MKAGRTPPRCATPAASTPNHNPAFRPGTSDRAQVPDADDAAHPRGTGSVLVLVCPSIRHGGVFLELHDNPYELSKDTSSAQGKGNHLSWMLLLAQFLQDEGWTLVRIGEWGSTRARSTRPSMLVGDTSTLAKYGDFTALGCSSSVHRAFATQIQHDLGGELPFANSK